MKRFLCIISILVSLSATIAAQTNKAFVIPIETEIDHSAFHHFRQGLKEAKNFGSDLIIIKLNTYGGAIDSADSIRIAIMRTQTPTVAFVDPNAASAGALIALACDSVYMAPGASMGSATVVNGAGEPMPEKYQSYMSTIMRATAEHHGRVLKGDSMVWRRNPDIAASMVNPEISVSMTGRQAMECGYADGLATDIDDILADLDMAGAQVGYYQSTLTDDILGFLSNAAVRAILVMLILGGIYMEMHTPGLGFAAAVSVVSAVLYFLPMFVVGSIPAWVLILFICGLVLIALEVFVIPGFGVAGVTGIAAIAVALTSALAADSVSGLNFSSIANALITIGIGSALAIALILYLTGSHGPKFFRKHSELMTELSVAEGFVGVDMSPARLVGHIAIAATDLRPAGKITVDGKIYDAVSTGIFINSGQELKIVKYENAQLYVEQNG